MKNDKFSPIWNLKTQVIIVLQGKNESFEDYQKRLNDMLGKIKNEGGNNTLAFPCGVCCASDGRMTTMINHTVYL